MPAVNCIAPPSAESEPASNEPSMGPVHEKETRASVSAIKKMPTTLPAPALLSVWLLMLLGNVISKTPKKEIANTIKMIKKPTFK